MKTIKQSVVFRATPHEVYEALMDSKKHAQFTGAKAVISRQVGGKISAYDGWIEAVNEELVPDKKIVQKWRGADWPEGHWSTAVFEFTKVKEGTKLIFTQTYVPDDQVEHISQGWKEHYWERMKEMLERDFEKQNKK